MRADRLLSMMLLLNARGRMTARDLSAELEVSERTVYRDVEALSVAGVPIYTQTGINGGVFLDEHYRLSLNGLTKNEIMTLFVASGEGPLRDIGLEDTAHSTLLKLLAALPTRYRDDVTHLRQRFYIDPLNWFQHAQPQPLLPRLQQAVWEDRCVEITYQPVEGERSSRLVEPYGLVAKAHVWYLVAKKPGGNMHTYRLSRFEDLTVTEQPFQRDPDFDLTVYWQTACERFEQESMERFPPYWATLHVQETILWELEGYLIGRYERQGSVTDGWAVIRIRFDSISEASGWVFSHGDAVRIIAPDSLREHMRQQARAYLNTLE